MPRVSVTACQPLALGTRPTSGAPAPTHQHIPGSVLRGALAAAWIGEHGEPSRQPELRSEFISLFDHGVRFGPLFARETMLVPLSMLRCKYQPTDACGSHWFDEAFDQTAPDAACPSCDGPLARGRGQIEHFPGSGGQFTSRTTRVAISEAGTAEEGALYTRDAIWHRDPAGRARHFTGRIIGAADWLLKPRRLLLGGRRSTSGAVDYTAEPDPAGNLPQPSGRRLVIRLISPALLVDSAARPTHRLDTRLLADLLGAPVTEAHRWVRRETVGGWHAASNLPKPDEHAVSAGSVYALELGDEPDPHAVQGLLDHGIGLRRAEGYGWVETGPWYPPPPPTPAPDAAPDQVAVGLSERLLGHDPALGRWLIRELRDYLAYRAAGGEPHTSLMRRPRLETLPKRDRHLLTALLAQGQPARVAAVIDILEARIRGVRP